MKLLNGMHAHFLLFPSRGERVDVLMTGIALKKNSSKAMTILPLATLDEAEENSSNESIFALSESLGSRV